MRLPDVLLVALGQSPDSPITNRRSLLGGLTLLAAVTGSSQAASGKRRNKRKKKRCKPSKRCDKGCCSPDSCFASAVDDVSVEPLGFACCPADKLCISTKPPYPDQCCYPDETCQPSLTDDIFAETICCRPCNGACCLKLNEECIGGVCTLVSTARLARTRRPG
ncbi:MAG: hypothetical protein U0Z70_22760 [Thermomicrobiales bacterium]